ncbi:MAG: nitrous oxide-stimulated promoter family protein [Desulfotalea sp.]
MKKRTAKSIIDNEQESIKILIAIYCKDHHTCAKGQETILCNECLTLQQYALERLDKCPYQENKKTCKYCPTHCYKPSMREQIKKVMRYSGPKLLWRYPAHAFKHFWLNFNKFFQGKP